MREAGAFGHAWGRVQHGASCVRLRAAPCPSRPSAACCAASPAHSGWCTRRGGSPLSACATLLPTLRPSGQEGCCTWPLLHMAEGSAGSARARMLHASSLARSPQRSPLECRQQGGEEAARQWRALEQRMAPLQVGAALLPAAALRADPAVALTMARFGPGLIRAGLVAGQLTGPFSGMSALARCAVCAVHAGWLRVPAFRRGCSRCLLPSLPACTLLPLLAPPLPYSHCGQSGDRPLAARLPRLGVLCAVRHDGQGHHRGRCARLQGEGR